MRTTRYFDEQILARRPYLTIEMCIAAAATPLRRKVQADGRIRIWSRVTLPGESNARILRIVLLEDGVTLHNAFVDRGFREDGL